MGDDGNALSSNRNGWDYQGQNSWDDTQETSKNWSKVGTEIGRWFELWLLSATSQGSLALSARDGVGSLLILLDGWGSQRSSGEREDGEDLGELHFKGLLVDIGSAKLKLK